MLTIDSTVCFACRSGKDKALHDLIGTDILPQLIESAAARRRAEEKQAAIEAMPKKRSSRLQVQCLLFVQYMTIWPCQLIIWATHRANCSIEHNIEMLNTRQQS